MVIRIKAKVKRWQVHIHGYYLTLMRNHMALATRLDFRYVRQVTFIIRVSRRVLSRKPALPYGAVNVSVHDRRFALFRRRAVVSITGNHMRILIHPGQLPGNGGPVSRRPTNQYLFYN